MLHRSGSSLTGLVWVGPVAQGRNVELSTLVVHLRIYGQRDGEEQRGGSGTSHGGPPGHQVIAVEDQKNLKRPPEAEPRVP